MLVAEVVIPQMFSAYAEDLGYVKGLHHYQYFCKQCDQVFASAWGRKPGTYPPVEMGAYFVCPNCGKMHHKNVVYINRDEAAPNKIRLTIKSFKNVVTFEIFSKTAIFPEYLRLLEGSHKETFRFDIVKQTVSFSVYDNGVKSAFKETIEMGNPFKLDILNKSILRFFHPNSFANSEQKSKLIRILRIFRETVHRKLEKHLGHKVSSMYVSPGQYHGTFLLPILNMAYRVTCPDAPNLPAVYRKEPENIHHYWKVKMLRGFNHDLMDMVISLTRQKKDFISAMITAHSLPNKPLVRQLLNKDPFGVNLFFKSFAICQNYDNAINLYQGLYKLITRAVHGIAPIIHTHNYEEFLQFLQEIKSLYGEPGVVRLVNETEEFQVQDYMNLYKQLNNENKKALENEKVRLRDLHDWMSLRHKKQTHVNVKFDVPDHIVRRLSMQKERLEFFLPKESIELLEAGYSLHNCVASYGNAMKDHEKWIVLVADDKGKLAACMEISEKGLVQAKLDRNKPVSGNKELNDAIVAYAKETNIKINTPDIKVPTEKKIKVRVSA